MVNVQVIMHVVILQCIWWQAAARGHRAYTDLSAARSGAGAHDIHISSMVVSGAKCCAPSKVLTRIESRQQSHLSMSQQYFFI